MVIITLIHSFKLPTVLAFFLTIFIVAAVGGVLERFALRPARRPTVMGLMLIALAYSVFIKGIARSIWGTDYFTFPAFSGNEPIFILKAAVHPQSLWVVGVSVLVVISMTIFYKYTLLGKAMLACSINKRMASLMGINVNWLIFIGFLLSAAVGATGGILISPIAMTSYWSGPMWALKGFCSSVFGGMGNMMGGIIGGLLLGMLESLGAGLVSSGYKDAFAFIILLLLLYLRPTGIMGEPEREHALL
jgi:branched-chain amino acid transport system permease protein